ncbi:MAG: ribosome assembly cofactor RimP [Bacteroidales bacterium]
MIPKEHIRTLAEQQIAGTDKFIVDVKVGQGNKIRVFMDADSSITINDCMQLSRFVESQLDRETEDFELEVSSAGLDFPLLLVRQYRKNIGNEVKVITKDGIVKKGVITEVLENGFTITETVINKINKKKEIAKVTSTLAFEYVKETMLVVNI